MPDSNDPFAPGYQPKYIYEFHINNPQNAKPQQPIYPQGEFDIPLTKQISTKPIPGFIETCEVDLSFQGTIQCSYPVMPTYLEKNQDKFKAQWSNSIMQFLNGIQLNAANIVRASLNESQATLAFTAQGYTSSNASITSKGVSVTASTDHASVTLSTEKPTTITFYFYTTELNVKSNPCQFTGTLYLQLSITLTPQNPEPNAAPILTESDLIIIGEAILAITAASIIIRFISMATTAT